MTAARQVLDFVERLQLELVPGPEESEFESTRVLRAGSQSVDALTRVQRLMKAGEGPSIEFKSSMLCAVREWEMTSTCIEYSSLPGEILKTICAFLNTNGGDLLVGVSDDGQPCNGISLDLELKHWNLDKWELHFQSLVAGRFFDGTLIAPYLRTQMIKINSTPVFHVRVMTRTDRSFVRREKGQAYEFFTRNGPRTDGLALPDFYAHMKAQQRNW